jgi:hypothetical protein
MARPKKPKNPYCTVIGRNSTDPEAVIKREVSTLSQINKQEDTLIYGDGDNLPLRIAQLVNESPAASACIKTRAKYIKGSGFSNPDLMRIKIDKFGTTLWDFHTKLCDMLALFEGFAVNFKFDGEGKITNSYILSFESVRLGKPDDYGFITLAKYNPYFGTDQFKKEFTTAYPVWDIQEVLNQIEVEGTKYNGQVYYYGKTSPLYRFYPVPDYWSAKNWINIDGKIQEFHASNLEKGFFQTLIWNIIGDPSLPSTNPDHQKTYTEDGVTKTKSVKTAGEAFTEMMTAAFAGASKAGGGIGLWSQNAETATKFTPAPTNQNHDLFATLQDLTTKNITIATQTPGILANISEGVSLGSGGSEIQKAVELMQGNTKEERNTVEQFYNEVLLPNLAKPPKEKVEIVNYNPVTVPVEIEDKFWDAMDAEEKRDFIRKNVPGVTLKEALVVTPNTAVPLPDGSMPPPAEPAQQPNEALKNLNLNEIKRVSKIAAQYTLQQLTYDQAKQILLGYGLTETDIDAWLTKPEEI